ncbi:PleD family two-component system response regulator [Vitiosangium sp. GDMCC 1.1324]|uniref:response regulator n=1 Tax=Vitiosangium sp. (strain GDMCC 1.1324) TaxID=2138576 RepID=UPI000D336C01|nr:response regulator [Vitiosangium sp. GDMCC 1.1324]PTL75776.1 two-component system response regulator [Vitiosangium sp. GDMCC 1.1324]
MAQQQGTVLVVEDSPMFRKMLSDMLQVLGFTRILEAFSGQTAMELLEEQRPDLVCLDLTLPDISGYEVCEYIRATPALKEIPVLMISARTQTMDRAQAEEAGASGYLIKPFTPEDLQQQVERVMAARPRKEG